MSSNASTAPPMAAAPSPSRYDPLFDKAAWRLGPERLASGSVMLAYVVGLWSLHDAQDDFVAVLLGIEVLLLWLPWKLPRSRRSPVGFWLESLVGLLAPGGAVVWALVHHSGWLTTGAAWWWLVAGAAVGCALLVLSGTRIRRLVSGELAFFYGPTRRSHGIARASTGLVGGVCEEALFRAPLLTAVAGAGTPFALLSASAFVAAHHAQPGSNGRGNTRAVLVEICAAVSLTVLTVVSGSIFPALIAHVINNIPSVVVELQREREETP